MNPSQNNTISNKAHSKVMRLHTSKDNRKREFSDFTDDNIQKIVNNDYKNLEDDTLSLSNITKEYAKPIVMFKFLSQIICLAIKFKTQKKV